MDRKSLAEIGITSGTTKDLPWKKAEQFLLIGRELEKIKAEDSKKRAKK